MAAALLISADIVLRNWFSISLPGTDELAGYALAISATWALSFTLMERAHIRIDSFYILLSQRIQVLLDLFAVFLILTFFGFVTYHAWITVEQSIEVSAHSQSALAIPLAVPQSIWFAGLLFLLVACVIVIASALTKYFSGDYRAAQSIIGAKTIDEEVAEEASTLDVTISKRN